MSVNAWQESGPLYHPTLGLRVIKKSRRRSQEETQCRVPRMVECARSIVQIAASAPPVCKDIILIERMRSDDKLKASREGSK